MVTGAFNTAIAGPLFARATFPVHPLFAYEEHEPKPPLFDVQEPVTLAAGIKFNKF